MLPQFFHCKNNDEPATDYIICTLPPFVIGKVIQFKSYEPLRDFIAAKKAKDEYFLGAQVKGYNVLIVYAGSLLRTEPLTHTLIYEQMAEEYLKRIQQREQRFKRYRI